MKEWIFDEDISRTESKADDRYPLVQTARRLIAVIARRRWRYADVVAKNALTCSFVILLLALAGSARADGLDGQPVVLRANSAAGFPIQHPVMLEAGNPAYASSLDNTRGSADQAWSFKSSGNDHLGAGIMVPEPTTLTLLALGIAGYLVKSRRGPRIM